MSASRYALMALVLATFGCVRFEPPPPPPNVSANAAWGPVFLAAQRDAVAGRHDDAERVLRDFAGAYPGTMQGAESMYWRAVFMLDPSNVRASPREAAAVLDQYLEYNVPLAHRAEALVLRRVASALASARETATARGAASDSRDAEIKRLKDELEKTTAELERIRKRLSPPPPGAPPPTPPPRIPHPAG